MGTIQFRIVGAGLFFLLIFLSGFWLRRSGKPYNTIIFSIHKIIGLTAGVYLIMTVYQIHQPASLNPVEITAIIVSVLFFSGTVAAGGLLSIDKPMPAAISMMHKLSPYLTVLSTMVTLYLFVGS
jgi:hypothetical protein